MRHTYVCLRLMEGAGIYEIAEHCHMSVEMIEKYHAAHIKTRRDAVPINITRTKKNKKGKRATKNTQAHRNPDYAMLSIRFLREIHALLLVGFAGEVNFTRFLAEH